MKPSVLHFVHLSTAQRETNIVDAIFDVEIPIFTHLFSPGILNEPRSFIIIPANESNGMIYTSLFVLCKNGSSLSIAQKSNHARRATRTAAAMAPWVAIAAFISSTVGVRPETRIPIQNLQRGKGGESPPDIGHYLPCNCNPALKPRRHASDIWMPKILLGRYQLRYS